MTFIQKFKKNNLTQTRINLFLFKTTLKNKLQNCVAIVDPGGIGDYILHRQYFKYFKQSPEYKNKNLIYFGREQYNNMVKHYDSDVFSEIFAYDCIDKKELRKQLSYYKFDSLIHLQTMCGAIAYSQAKSERMDFIKGFKVKTKIANAIMNDYYDNKAEKYLKSIYSQIIFTNEETFEPERLRTLYEKLLGIKIEQENTKLSPIFDFSQKYICISLASVGEYRNYSIEGWVKILKYLTTNLQESYKIVILGTKREEDIINTILLHFDKSEKIINLTGLIDITLIPSIIKNAQWLLSIETGTVHIAQAVNCKTICLSSGGFYGRFLPYTNGLTEYIFPDSFDEIIKDENQELLSKYYDYERTHKTSDINPDKVIKVLKKYIN